ncbi:ribosome recycling factor ['Camptotheca acuminata' phytoplasma]|uniref:ribosome recycling factor n=1 Tax='Camptotheca acuminata' phytoplasma TaxID=3239192 RepID=UPI00351A63F5
MEDLLNEILQKIDKKMLQTNESMLMKFDNIRTGRANSKILDKITVNYYDTDIILKNVSTINVLEGNQIHIKPFDHTLIPKIEKAILNSDLGITPQNDGNTIKLIFPQPTEEKRKILIKEVNKIKEQNKIIIRNICRQGKDEVKKLKLNEFLEGSFLKKIQDVNDKFMKLIDNETIQKNNELLKI